MRKTVNQVTLCGKLYTHSLEHKVSQKGVDYIGGTITIATDDDNMNTVTVTYVYVAANYPAKNGKPERPNPNYAMLNRIMENGKTITENGADEAWILKLTPALSVNDFVSRDGEMVAAPRLEGGFVSQVYQIPEKDADRNQFKADAILTSVRHIDADEERNIPKDYCEIKGFIFNFANAMLPVTFTMRGTEGMKYFEGLDISHSNPVFTQVWGPIQSKTIVTTKEEPSAFGEPIVREVTRTSREWEITGARPETYEIGEDITPDEINEALKAREMRLAEVKAQNDAWIAKRDAGALAATSAPTAAPAKASFGAFSF